MKSTNYYLYGIGLGVSVLFNALCGGLHYEPLCSTAQRLNKKGKPWLASFLDFCLGKDHCKLSHADYILARRGKLTKR